MSVLFMPPNSSNLNPIEKVWGLLKGRLQKNMTELKPVDLILMDLKPKIIETIQELQDEDKMANMHRAHYQHLQLVMQGVQV